MSSRTNENQLQKKYPDIPLESPAQTIVAVDSAYAQAERDAFKDRLRAALAKQVMENTAALANTESYYLKIAPGGAAEYRQIVQTYTKLALVKLIGGEL